MEQIDAFHGFDFGVLEQMIENMDKKCRNQLMLLDWYKRLTEMLEKRVQRVENLTILHSQIDQISNFKFNNIRQLEIQNCEINDL